MKKKRLLTYALSYLAIVAGFTGYWASQFQQHIHVKGDDFGMCVDFLVPLTYLFCIFLGLLVLWILGLGGTPRQIICIFCPVYSLLAVLCARVL